MIVRRFSTLSSRSIYFPVFPFSDIQAYLHGYVLNPDSHCCSSVLSCSSHFILYVFIVAYLLSRLADPLFFLCLCTLSPTVCSSLLSFKISHSQFRDRCSFSIDQARDRLSFPTLSSLLLRSLCFLNSRLPPVLYLDFDATRAYRATSYNKLPFPILFD